MSIQLPLSNRPGLFAIVSNEDEVLVSPYRWYLSNNGYVVARVQQDGKLLLLYLHRLALQAKPGQICDHMSGDKLDNTRENLRFVTPQQNVRNRRVPCNSRTRLIGVTPYRDQYLARIRVNS